MAKKVRFSVSVRADQYKWLKARSAFKGRPMSQVILDVFDWAMLEKASGDVTLDRSYSQDVGYSSPREGSSGSDL
jgi:hypothetical protein